LVLEPIVEETLQEVESSRPRTRWYKRAIYPLEKEVIQVIAQLKEPPSKPVQMKGEGNKHARNKDKYAEA